MNSSLDPESENISDKLDEVLDHLAQLQSATNVAKSNPSLNDVAEQLALKEQKKDDPFFKNPFADENGQDPLITALLCELPLIEVATNLVAIDRCEESITSAWIWMPNCPLPCDFCETTVFHVQCGKYALNPGAD